MVDSSILTFINHGCNFTNNVGKQYSVSEMTADLNEMPPDMWYEPVESHFFDPFVDRYVLSSSNGVNLAYRIVFV